MSTNSEPKLAMFDWANKTTISIELAPISDPRRPEDPPHRYDGSDGTLFVRFGDFGWMIWVVAPSLMDLGEALPVHVGGEGSTCQEAADDLQKNLLRVLRWSADILVMGRSDLG
jgi:hypothetical protein